MVKSRMWPRIAHHCEIISILRPLIKEDAQSKNVCFTHLEAMTHFFGLQIGLKGTTADVLRTRVLGCYEHRTNLAAY